MAILLAGGPSLADQGAVSRVRVCADPANLPATSRETPGFENEIAAVLAGSMGARLEMIWRPLGASYLRRTLLAGECDAVFGFEAGHWLAATTRPYYASAYAIVVRADGALAGVRRLSDPRLVGHPLGVVAGSPPAAHLARRGLIGDVRPYRLSVDQPFEGSTTAMLQDLGAGVIDAAFLWGPLAGPKAAEIGGLVVTPLVEEDGPPSLTYRIAIAVRPEDEALRAAFDDHIARRGADISAILARWHVPALEVEPLN